MEGTDEAYVLLSTISEQLQLNPDLPHVMLPVYVNKALATIFQTEPIRIYTDKRMPLLQ
jgi:hypothetical protein